ncbi:MAG: hypothetical protein AB1798_14225, partial [Spirochaetota bacterium]
VCKRVDGLGLLHPILAGKLFKEKILDHHFRDFFPTQYLEGEFTFAANTLAGMIIGWIHHPMNFIVKVPVSKGRILLSTFPLKRNILKSPSAWAFLQQLLKMAEGERKEAE